MKRKCILLLIILILPAFLFAQTGEEIVKKMESIQKADSIYSKGRMIINDRFGEREKTYITYQLGEDKTLIEWTNIEEKGQKILRLKDRIALYYPDGDVIIDLRGAALKDKVLGSDFSYEDMTNEQGILDMYTVKLVGTETIDGNACYKLELTARNRKVLYQKQDVWVDKELYVVRLSHKKTKSGDLLKEETIKDYKIIGNKHIPTRIKMIDKKKKNSSTEILIDEMEIDIKIDSDKFTREGLSS